MKADRGAEPGCRALSWGIRTSAAPVSGRSLHQLRTQAAFLGPSLHPLGIELWHFKEQVTGTWPPTQSNIEAIK